MAQVAGAIQKEIDNIIDNGFQPSHQASALIDQHLESRNLTSAEIQILAPSRKAIKDLQVLSFLCIR